MNYKSYFLILALLLCTTITRAQYNQVNDIPYREAAEGYAQERCKLDVYYPTSVLTRHPSLSSLAIANWNSSGATRSRPTSGAC